MTNPTSQPLRVHSSCAFVDDSPDMLEMVELVMQREPPAQFFVAPERFGALEELLARNALLLANEQRSIQEIVATQDVESNTRAAPAVHRYFANPERLDLVGVLIADHRMPGEMGIPFCARHRQVGLQRLLLTGEADESMAIAAFNQGSIEHYMPKQTRASGTVINRLLIDEIRRQRALSAEVRGRSLLLCQDAGVSAALEHQRASAALKAILDELQIVEYMALGLPAGIFALSADQRAYWLQFETDRDHVEMLDMMRDHEWPADAQDRVTAGKTLVNFTWMQPLELQPAEVPLRLLQADPYLAVGITQLDDLPAVLQPVHFT